MPGNGEIPGVGNITGGGSSAGVDTSGTLLDFDVTWDDINEADFTDVTETVPTDVNHEEYEDFLENSSFNSQIKITYSGSSATVSGTVSGVTISNSGAHVTVNSTVANVEYVLSGSTTDGSLKVYSEKKFKVTLDGVSLTSQQGAAINIQSSKRAFIVAKDGTSNTLTDASSYSNSVAGEDQKGCLFSEGQLVFYGKGALTIKANYKHAICSDDYVYVHSGANIIVSSAPKDAIHANDKIVMNGGKLILTPSGDGLDCEEGLVDIRGGLLKANITGVASKAIKATTNITVSDGILLLLTSGTAEYDSTDKDISSSACFKCDANMSITGGSIFLKSTGAAGKGINCDGTFSMSNGLMRIITTGKQYVYGSLDSSPKGLKADGTLTINGGTIWVKATGGEGSEGIESKSVLTVNNGEIQAFCYDDCMNAKSSIVINGGNIYCYASGNDGIDSNGTLTITGGTIVASGTTTPEEGIDCDSNTFKITGGTLIGVGGATSTPTSSVCTQRSLVYGASGSSGTLISIVGPDNAHVMSYTIPRTYSQMTMLFSSNKLESGKSYTIYTGGSVEGGSDFCGLVVNGTYTAGTAASSFTATNMVTTVGNASSGMGGGGNTGGNKPGGGWW